MRAGGLLVLLMPPAADWAAFPTPITGVMCRSRKRCRCYPHFLQRLLRLLQADPDVWHWDLSAERLQAPLPELPAVAWQRWRMLTAA